jgi:hypothetical protein
MYERWEYKVLTSRFRSGFQDEQGTKYGRLTEEVLNRLGEEGWEVCGYNHSFVSAPTLILKRKVSPAR